MARLGVLLLLGGAFGCHTPARLAYDASELRAEVARRAPEVDARDVIIPFQVDAEQAARARTLIRRAAPDSERARVLIDALFDPDGFGLRYASAATGTARDTLQAGEGNCLSIASALVGLARSAGLSAYYMDASEFESEVRRESEVIVKAGHVTAVVATERGYTALDFDRELRRYQRMRLIDDLEALAHFYNNRGYEVIHDAQIAGREIPWLEAAASFALATRVEPEFEEAWNNLGVAYARLGRPAEAERRYRQAIVRNPRHASPHNNLGLLYLQAGDLTAALDAFDVAARLDPDNPHVSYNRAVVLFEQGDMTGATKALERAIKLRKDYDAARSLLARIARERTGAADGDSSTVDDSVAPRGTTLPSLFP